MPSAAWPASPGLGPAIVGWLLLLMRRLARKPPALAGDRSAGCYHYAERPWPQAPGLGAGDRSGWLLLCERRLARKPRLGRGTFGCC